MSFFIAVRLVVTLLCTTVACIAVASSNTTPVASCMVCYVVPNRMTDLGFSYNFNVARRRVHAELALAFPGYTLGSALVQDTSALSTSSLNVTLRRFIQTKQCSLVMSVGLLSGSSNFLYLIPPDFPDVRFVEYSARVAVDDAGVLPAPLPPNMRGFTLGFTSAWFAAGVAAAVQCNRCVGFLSPFENQVFSVNAFARGMRWAAERGWVRPENAYRNSTSCPLYSITQNSFFDPVAEEQVATLFIEKGCDLIAYWNDDQTISAVVAEHMANMRGGSRLRTTALVDDGQQVFSLSYNVDATLLWGDSVFVSVVVTPDVVLRPMITDAMLNRSLTSVVANGTAGAKLSAFSPLANRTAVAAATAAYDTLRHENLWCGGFQATDGSWWYHGCMREEMLFVTRPTVLDVLVHRLPPFVKRTACPSGTRAVYDDLVNFSLRCEGCPADSVSNNTGVCIRCPAHQQPDGNQSGCIPRLVVPAQSVKVETVVVPSVVGIAAVLAISLGVVYALMRLGYLRGKLGVNVAPSRRVSPWFGPHVGIVIVAVDPLRSAKVWRDQVDFASNALDDISNLVADACVKYEAHIAVVVADVHLLITESPVSAIRVADAILHDFRALDNSTSRHLRLRVAVSGADVAAVEVKLSPAVDEPASIGGQDVDGEGSRKVPWVTLAPSRHPRRAHHISSSCDVNLAEASPLCSVVHPDVAAAYRGQFTSAHYVGASLESLQRHLVNWVAVDGYSMLIHDDATSIGDRDQFEAAVADMVGSGRNLIGINWDDEIKGGDRSNLQSNVHKQPSGFLLRDTSCGDCVVADALVVQSDESKRMPPARGDESAGANESEKDPTDTMSVASTVVSTSLDFVMPRFSLLSRGQVKTLTTIGVDLVRQLVKRLDSDKRRIVVREACRRLHVSLDMHAAKRVKENRDGSSQLVFGERVIVERVMLELLSTMDEQHLDEWLTITSSLRAASRRKNRADTK